jgi:peroxiredoxin
MRPDSTEVNLALAEGLQGLGQFAEARPYAEAAVKQEPDSAEAHRTLAGIYDGLHLSSKAAAEWKFVKASDQALESHAAGPKRNEEAPDFSLPQAGSGKKVTLRDFRGKSPVVLIFGSYTCPNFRAAAEPLKGMYHRYGGSVPFLLVYVREAHDTSNWQSTRNSGDEFTLPPATTATEKENNSMVCSRKLHLPFPALVDGMDRAVEASYEAWPSRVYVISDEGKILYSSHLTELDFHPDEMEAVVRRSIRRAHEARR